MRDEQIRRYARHILLPDVGGIGQRRLLAAAVRVADARMGAALLYLAAAGVGTLVIEDEGRVDAPDGFLYRPADVGRPRREVAAERLAALNPDVRVIAAGDAGYHLEPLPAGDAVDALERGAAAAAALVGEIVG